MTLMAVGSLAALGWAAPEALFPPAGNVQQRLVTEIDKATQSIDVAMYELSAPLLMQALRRAGERGVAVRVVLDDSVLRNSAHDKIMEPTGHVSLRSLKGRKGKRGMMHDKFAIFDQTKVATGSYNWTQGAEHVNYENLLLEDDSGIVQAYAQAFDALWSTGSATLPPGKGKRKRLRVKSTP